MASSTGSSSSNISSGVGSDNNTEIESTMDKGKNGSIHLNVPQRMLVVPAIAFVVGTGLGIMRGGRTASLRFLAENAHRPPTTVQGWYFYKKTKNYRVMLGALKGAGLESTRLSVLALSFVGLEEGASRLGWSGSREIFAGFGSAVLFSIIYRLPLHVAKRAIGAGVMAGGVMGLIRWTGSYRPVANKIVE